MEIKKNLVGKQVLGVKFDSTEDLNYLNEMDDYVGVVGTVVMFDPIGYPIVEFYKSDKHRYLYPTELLKEVTESETNVSTNLCKESVVEETPVELKLEVGKSYVDGASNVIKIVEYDEHTPSYPYQSEDGSGYAQDGKWIISSERNLNNLVREYVEDPQSDSENTFECGLCERDFPVSERTEDEKEDMVNNPSHYKLKSGVEVIDIIEGAGLGFHLANVTKYVLRAGKKDPSKELEDLKKAEYYLQRKIKQLEEEMV